MNAVMHGQKSRRRRDGPSVLESLSGRAEPPQQRSWLVLAGGALMFGALLALVIIYWPDDAAFIYEGF